MDQTNLKKNSGLSLFLFFKLFSNRNEMGNRKHRWDMEEHKNAK